MHKKKLKVTLFVIGGMLVCYGFTVLKLSDDLSAPKRRAIQEYHKEWLDAPEKQAIKITEAISPKGSFPYYVVEPAGDVPVKRGQILRKQLTERGVVMPEFGAMNQHLILLHGRKGNKEDLLPIAERYAAVGFRCLLPDLPGHGKNPLERSCFGTNQDNRTALMSMVESEENLMKYSKKSVLIGMSMGGSFANQLAGENKDAFSAVVIINSFDRLENVIDNSFKNYLPGFYWTLSGPVKLCSKKVLNFDISRADSIEGWGECKLPLLVVHGDQDELIPVNLGKNFYESVSTHKKKWISVKGANHTNVLITAHPLYADIVEFIRSGD